MNYKPPEPVGSLPPATGGAATRIADDFPAIAPRLLEIEEEKKREWQSRKDDPA